MISIRTEMVGVATYHAWIVLKEAVEEWADVLVREAWPLGKQVERGVDETCDRELLWVGWVRDLWLCSCLLCALWRMRHAGSERTRRR